MAPLYGARVASTSHGAHFDEQAAEEAGSAPGALDASRAGRCTPLSGLQRQAWEWALAQRTSEGELPSGRAIAVAHGRSDRWGRNVKRNGLLSSQDAGDDAGADARPRLKTDYAQ